MHGHAGEHVQAGQEHQGHGREKRGARDVGGRKFWNDSFINYQCCCCCFCSCHLLFGLSDLEEAKAKEEFISIALKV